MTGSKANLILADKQPGEVDRFSHLGAENMQRSSVFGNHRPSSIGRIGWMNFVSNSKFRSNALGPRVQPLERVLNQNRLRWLEHVFRMHTHRLPRHTLFFDAGKGWKMVRRG